MIRLKYIPKKEGVKGTLPLGCYPLWGREGVILQAAAENERISTKEYFNEPKIVEKLPFLCHAVIYPCHVTCLEDSKKGCQYQDYQNHRKDKAEDCYRADLE